MRVSKIQTFAYLTIILGYKSMWWVHKFWNIPQIITFFLGFPILENMNISLSTIWVFQASVGTGSPWWAARLFLKSRVTDDDQKQPCCYHILNVKVRILFMLADLIMTTKMTTATRTTTPMTAATSQRGTPALLWQEPCSYRTDLWGKFTLS